MYKTLHKFMYENPHFNILPNNFLTFCDCGMYSLTLLCMISHNFILQFVQGVLCPFIILVTIHH